MTDKEKRTKLLKEIKQYLRKDVGPKCKDFTYSCFACSAWLAYDILKDVWSLTEEGVDFKNVKRHKK